MSNVRALVQDVGGLMRAARNGDTILNPVITTVTADAADTVTVAKIAGGVVQYTGFTTAAKNLTTDTAANILAAFPALDIGDSISMLVSCVNAFAGTWVAGAGVTLAGRATTPASSYSLIYITKTSATTVTWTVL